MQAAITVRQLNMYVKSILDANPKLSSVCVCGEIANFQNHFASGHLYFALKDDAATIRSVMFRSSALRLKFTPQNGQKVICFGRVSLYEKDGQYQFYAENMLPFGEGELAADFERIKAALLKDGLFDEKRKRALPKFPKRVGVVTSSSGAAIHDITSVLNRRYPICTAVCYPVNVQGAGASQDMVNALRKIYESENVDVIIIGRGGGSSYDLWAFNDETLARTIAQSPVPVISAVGHESDYSICDLVADVRAATPSVAAELAVPNIEELLKELKFKKHLLCSLLKTKVQVLENKLNAVKESAVFKDANGVIINKREQLQLESVQRFKVGINNLLLKNETELREKILKLDSLSPLKVLSRGYSVVEKKNSVVTSAAELSVGDQIKITLNKGKINCSVISKEENDNDSRV